MASRIKVLELELTHPLRAVSGLSGYQGIRALVRWQGTPVGYINLPVRDGTCTVSALRAAIARMPGGGLSHAVLRRRLNRPLDRHSLMNLDQQANDETAIDSVDGPLVTVAVCTRDRSSQLTDCLHAVNGLSYDNLEIVVVDNAPSTDETRKLVAEVFPNMRYVVERRPGLDWARNRAIEEANGEILAYTDDDVIVDPLWVDALVGVFQDDPSVMAVTGLVAPYELDTPAQKLFEKYGGFGRGFSRHWYRIDGSAKSRENLHIGAGRFGTGANMAYRRSVFGEIGGFDPALDVGTVTNGGGDLEMFFRVLEEGHTLVYEPSALVWHRHRRSMQQLRIQLTNHGVGLYSYFVRSAIFYPRRRWSIVKFGLWWMWHWNIRRLLKSFVTSPPVPRELIWAELRGGIIGLGRYPQARRRAEQVARQYQAERLSAASDDIAPVRET